MWQEKHWYYCVERDDTNLMQPEPLKSGVKQINDGDYEPVAKSWIRSSSFWSIYVQNMATMRALVTWLLAAGKRGSASSSKRGRRWLSTLAELHIRQELRSAVAFNDSFDLSSWTDCTHGHGRLLSCLNLRSWPGSTEMRWRRLQGRPVLPACAARRKRCRHTLQGLSDLVHRGNAAILVGQYTAAAAFWRELGHDALICTKENNLHDNLI
jgi:hypothetical protein